ncbi:unnamed protein product [Mesocestoides corti]|uniref:Calpain catalytic domain-containing protein n=1 Tax=Mesocestoides corti TaxID=53468 RepID=A0A158QW30_MESCO|nr:unnamed protein product [Mesocestoides corti]
MYSSYVLTFVRERIPPQRRQQAIVNLDGVGAANYVSLAPLPRADKKTKRRKRHRKVQLLPQFRGQSSKQLKRVMRQQQHPDVRRLTCPSDLPRRLHDLWNQYANSLIDLTKSAQSDEANITHQLENILRMDLIGARLRVLRSITTKQVDLEGIVVMETRNIFYLAREEVVDGKDAEETWLHIVPKRGTVFLLLMTRAEIVLNGNSLAYRPADRAVRKWKLNPSAGAKQKKRPLLPTIMAQIGFNIPLLTSTGEGWNTNRAPPRPPAPAPRIETSYRKPLAASLRRQIHQKETQSVVYGRRFVVSESLEHSRAWFKREVEAQLQRGGLYEDPFMPPVDSTIWPDRSSSSSKYKWLRPHEIVSEPMFIADGLSRFDIRQGELGDCWLLAALASLSMHENLLSEVGHTLSSTKHHFLALFAILFMLVEFQVVPGGQSFTTSSNGQPLVSNGDFAYVGMFWFRFWYFGYWVDVVVDDRLPTIGQRLVFLHSSDRREFWTALLEKAYAKLVGSYEALRGGTTSEGMEDFTGGISEMIDLGDKSPKNLFTIMCRAHSRCSLLACSIDADPNEVEADGPLGLIMGHAYSITDVRTIRDYGGSELQMVRLRNPWGNDKEWVGPWSDKSPEWARISPEERMEIGLTFDNDGEFCPEFDQIESKRGPPKRKWEMTRHEGEWLRNSTAGGCLNNRGMLCPLATSKVTLVCPFLNHTFHMNPQIRVSVVDADEADDDPTGTIVVGLLQKGMREKRQLAFSIGYAIYPFPPGAPPNALLTREFFLRTPLAARSIFANTREVCGRHKLTPGDYVIVPSTFLPNEEAKFLLRIFSERPYQAGELDDQIAFGVGPIAPTPASTKDDEMVMKLKAAFEAIAGDSGDIEAEDLRNILNRVFENKVGQNFEGFSLETARSMVALMDVSFSQLHQRQQIRNTCRRISAVDTSGTLGFEEFKTLWYELRLWLTIFKEADTSSNGKLKTCDLRTVLSDVGIKISNEIFKAIVCRYAYHGAIVFDDFILLLVRLITVFEKFKENLDYGQHKASFNVDDVRFLSGVLLSPTTTPPLSPYLPGPIFLRCVLYT